MLGKSRSSESPSVNLSEDQIEVIIGLHKALSSMIDKFDPDATDAEWLSHSNNVIRQLCGCDIRDVKRFAAGDKVFIERNLA